MCAAGAAERDGTCFVTLTRPLGELGEMGVGPVGPGYLGGPIRGDTSHHPLTVKKTETSGSNFQSSPVSSRGR